MRRPTIVIMLLIMVCAWIAPVHAQEDLTPEEQEALDIVHAALNHLSNANTYTADMTQKTIQNVDVSYLGQSIQVDQTITSEGTIQFEKTPENQHDNQQFSITQNILNVMSGAQNASQTVGPTSTDIIVVDDHIYLKMDVPAELQSFIPRGWQDVTEGTDNYPGMSYINIDNVADYAAFGGNKFIDSFNNAVQKVTVLEPETIDGRTAYHYRLGLDFRLALETIGAANLEQLFNAEEVPFDVAGYIEQIFASENSRYDADVLIFADDQTLYQLSMRMVMEVDIPSNLFTDPSMQGMEMTIKQDMAQIYQITGIDVPVSIQAPELDN